MKKYLGAAFTIWADERGNWAAWHAEDGSLYATSDTAEPEQVETVEREMATTPAEQVPAMERWMSHKEAVEDVLALFGWPMESRQEELRRVFVGREWPIPWAEMDQYDWSELYPVVSQDRIIDIYDAAWNQPEEYHRKPIVADEFIAADAPDGDYADDIYSTAVAAAILGVSETRARALCRSGRMGQRIGDTWIIYGRDILANMVREPGRPRMFTLRDYQTGEEFICPIRREQQAGEAVLLHVQHPEVGLVAVVVYPDGDYYTVADWQSEQPQDPADIPFFRWVSADGEPTVIVDGLPRRLC